MTSSFVVYCYSAKWVMLNIKKRIRKCLLGIFLILLMVHNQTAFQEVWKIHDFLLSSKHWSRKCLLGICKVLVLCIFSFCFPLTHISMPSHLVTESLSICEPKLVSYQLLIQRERRHERTTCALHIQSSPVPTCVTSNNLCHQIFQSFLHTPTPLPPCNV